MEVIKILEDLKTICPSSNLHADETFKTCLAEEIDAYWKNSSINKAYAVFNLNENGNVIFEGIQDSVTDNSQMSFLIEREVEDVNASLLKIALKEIPNLVEKYEDGKRLEEERKKKELFEEKRDKLLDKLLQEKVSI